jgi:hypothetical protein
MNKFAGRGAAGSLKWAIRALDRLYDAIRIPIHQRIAILFKSSWNIGFGPAPRENADDPLTRLVSFPNLPVNPWSLVRFFAYQTMTVEAQDIFIRRSRFNVASGICFLSKRAWFDGFARIELFRI